MKSSIYFTDRAEVAVGPFAKAKLLIGDHPRMDPLRTLDICRARRCSPPAFRIRTVCSTIISSRGSSRRPRQGSRPTRGPRERRRAGRRPTWLDPPCAAGRPQGAPAAQPSTQALGLLGGAPVNRALHADVPDEAQFRSRPATLDRRQHHPHPDPDRRVVGHRPAIRALADGCAHMIGLVRWRGLLTGRDRDALDDSRPIRPAGSRWRWARHRSSGWSCWPSPAGVALLGAGTADPSPFLFRIIGMFMTVSVACSPMRRAGPNARPVAAAVLAAEDRCRDRRRLRRSHEAFGKQALALAAFDAAAAGRLGLGAGMALRSRTCRCADR